MSETQGGVPKATISSRDGTENANQDPKKSILTPLPVSWSLGRV